VKDYIGKGQMTADYTLTFGDFNTFIGDVKLPIADDAKYYYEVEVKNIASVQQFGWMTEGFQSAERLRGEGVGDDNYSWGIDGVRTSKWGINGGGEDDNDDSDDNFGGQWTEGDVLGFAADMTTAGNVTLSFSHNGSFDTPYGVAFKKLSVQWLSPALTAQSGVYQVNFGDRPFKFAPPDESYASVHDYAKI